jgi:hypothetical protein
VTVRNGGSAAFAAFGPAANAGHVCFGSSLVNENQALGIEIDLPVKPGFAGCFYVLTFLLGGV